MRNTEAAQDAAVAVLGRLIHQESDLIKRVFRKSSRRSDTASCHPRLDRTAPEAQPSPRWGRRSPQISEASQKVPSSSSSSCLQDLKPQKASLAPSAGPDTWLRTGNSGEPLMRSEALTTPAHGTPAVLGLVSLPWCLQAKALGPHLRCRETHAVPNTRESGQAEQRGVVAVSPQFPSVLHRRLAYPQSAHIYTAVKSTQHGHTPKFCSQQVSPGSQEPWALPGAEALLGPARSLDLSRLRTPPLTTNITLALPTPSAPQEHP